MFFYAKLLYCQGRMTDGELDALVAGNYLSAEQAATIREECAEQRTG